MDALLLAIASGHPMQQDNLKQPKFPGSLPMPNQNIPSWLSDPVSMHSRNWAATGTAPPTTSIPAPAQARPEATNHSYFTSVPKQTSSFKGPRVIFLPIEEASLPRADVTSVRSALIHIVPSLKNGLASISCSSRECKIAFSPDGSLKLAVGQRTFHKDIPLLISST